MTIHYEIRKCHNGNDVLLDHVIDPVEVIRRLNQYNLTRELAGDPGIAYARIIETEND